jgi:hypothetical protein
VTDKLSETELIALHMHSHRVTNMWSHSTDNEKNYSH